MAFDAGSSIAHWKLDDSGFNAGAKRVTASNQSMLKSMLGAQVIFAAFQKVLNTLTTGLKDSVIKANEFRKELGNVSTLIDTTQISVDGLRSALLNFDSNLGNTTDLTKGLYQAFSAGAETAEEALKVTENSAKFAQAALTDTFTAVDVLTTAVNAYGKEVINTEKASDIFFTTIKFGKLTGEQLASTIGQSIPLFASTGIELEQLSAGMAALTKQGVNAANATTQLNAIVNSFLKPSEALSEALENAGYASGSALLETEGLAGALQLLETQTGGNATELANLLPNIRAIRGAMALTGVGGEEFTKILAEMENVTGATDEAFQKQEKTFKTFQNSMDKLQISIGSIANVFVDEFAKGATEAADGLTRFLNSAEGIRQITNVLATFSGVINVTWTILQKFFDLFQKLSTDIVNTFNKEFTDLVGTGNEANITFDLLGGVVKAISIGFTILAESIKATITNVFNLVNAVSKSIDVLAKFGEALIDPLNVDKWDAVGKAAENAGAAFTEFGSDLINGYANIIQTAINEVSTFFEDAEQNSNDLAKSYENGINGIKELMSQLSTSNLDVIDMFQNLEDQVGDTSDQLTDDLGGAADKVKKTWFSTLDELGQKLTESKDNFGIFSSQFQEQWQATIDHFNSGVGSMFDGFTTVMDSITAVRDQAFENQMTKLQLEQESERANIENSVLSEDEKKKRLEQLDKKFEAKKRALQRDQFQREKRSSIISSIINTALGVTKALASTFFPLNIVVAALVAAAGIAQTALIAAQPNPYQRGGIATAGQDILVGEQGPEILRLNNTSRVFSNAESREMMGRKVEQNITFTGDINSDVDLERTLNLYGKSFQQKLRTA